MQNAFGGKPLRINWLRWVKATNVTQTMRRKTKNIFANCCKCLMLKEKLFLLGTRSDVSCLSYRHLDESFGSDSLCRFGSA